LNAFFAKRGFQSISHTTEVKWQEQASPEIIRAFFVGKESW